MTVMPSSSEVADKAVSTEDAKSGVELTRLEAVLSALVESKLEAMKAADSRSAAQQQPRRAASEPVSPRPRPRLTSSSTLSSSHQHHQHLHHHHHHHHHQQHQHQHRYHHHHQHKSQHPSSSSSHRQHRRHGSGPCQADLDQHQPHGRPKHASKDFDPRLEMPDVDPPDGTANEPNADIFEYPRLHQSACYMSYSVAQLKSQYDEDDYLAFGYADELCGPDDEALSGPTSLTGPIGAAGSLPEAHYRQRPERFHRPRRKRKKRRRRKQRPSAHLIDIEADELGLAVVDPDDLPPRARWTIVATACLLLAMSLLLVGVTLRMAPIIDEMGDGRRASVCNKRKASSSGGRRASSAVASHRRDSVRPDNSRSPSALLANGSAASLEAIKDPRELARARRHRLVAYVLLATFAFILLAAVLAVVITLTHSSFHAPPIGSRELAEHRANDNADANNATSVRK